jgi:uncharacterized Zn finger protein (UPF0148 family)
MIKEISPEAKYFLEPNGGMGHLADVIKQPYTWEEAEAEYERILGGKKKRPEDMRFDESRRYYRVRNLADPDYGRKLNIDVIECDPNFCHVLSNKGYPLVGYDWLSYNGVSYYDAIVMNPPFSNGDDHLLKAWDFLFKGEIVCLLNAETIRNPYTANRKRVVELIEKHGRVTEMGRCFSTAERPTDVDVVRVYLKKDPPDDSADLWATEVTKENAPECEDDKEPDFVAIRDNLENLVRWYEMANQHFIKGFEEIRRGCLYMRQYDLSSAYEDRQASKDYGAICGDAMSSSQGARADFLRKHRKDAWYTVFKQFQFDKWLDSKQQERMMRDVARDMHLPFTVENIKATLENVFLSRKKLFDESVANIFDELTSAFAGNTNHRGGGGPNYSGWKTNDSYKANERLVFPYGCEVSWSGFRTRYGDTSRLYADIDRILCVLDGKPFEKCFLIGQAIERAKAGELIHSQYFEIRCYKKGTVHLKWKRKDLLEAFNKTAANGKKWIGENTQAKYKPREKKSTWECERNGHEFLAGSCSRCGEPESGEWDHVSCPLCKTVAEHTGHIECPLHPVIKERIETSEEPSPAFLALPAPSEPQSELFA